MKHTNISAKLKMMTVIATLHLFLVAIGAFELDLFSNDNLNSALDYYGSLSGASASYGFFAPGVDLQIRAVFDVENAHGDHQLVQLENGQNSEFYLRTGDIIENFYNDEMADPMKFQRDLASSLSATIFSRTPNARNVTIHLDEFKPVNMAEYRSGLHPKWQPIYSATFIKNSVVRR